MSSNTEKRVNEAGGAEGAENVSQDETLSLEELKSRIAAAKLKETLDKLKLGEDNRTEDSGAEDDDDDGYYVRGDGENDEVYTGVMLGLLKKPDHPLLMRRHYFPSKVGGMPAWLNPRDLPPHASMVCKQCHKPMRFLLQIYAPVMEKASAFHRTLYVFCCNTATCLLKHNSIRVLRAQLPRENEFYSSEPPEDPLVAIKKVPEHVTLAPEYAPHPGALICRVCGVPAKSRCSACKLIAYCSREHQEADWFAAHKLECQTYQEHQRKEKQGATDSNAGGSGTSTTDVAPDATAEVGEAKNNAAVAMGLPEDAPIKLSEHLTTQLRTTLAVSRRRLLPYPMDLQIEEEVLLEDEMTKNLERAKTENLLTQYEAERKDMDPEELAKADKRLEKELSGMVGMKPDDADEEDEGEQDKSEGDDDIQAIKEFEKDKDEEIDASPEAIAKQRNKVDPVFIAFQTRVESNPDQVVRYIPRGLRLKLAKALAEEKPDEDGAVKFESDYGDIIDSRMLAPVWVSRKKRLPKAFTPSCPNCKGPADFEFQIMPQILYHLEQAAQQQRAQIQMAQGKGTNLVADELEADDSLDFGTIVVYTCRESCGGSNGYYDEFVYVQPPHV